MSSAALAIFLETGTEAAARKAAATAFGAACKSEGCAANLANFVTMHEAIKSDDKKASKGREGVMHAVAAVASACGNESEAYLLPMMGAVLAQFGDKSKAVRDAAEVARAGLMTIASSQSTAMLITAAIEKMGSDEKFTTVVGACAVVQFLAGANGKETENCLPEIIPAVKPLLGDMKAEVSKAAIDTLESCIKLVTNRDILPFLPALVSALKDTSETTECIHKLAGTTFVATVSRGPLSVIVPLLVWGFREPKVATRRMCAKIAGNMAKLVDNQVEALPFLPELMPQLTRAVDTISDPEARGVCEETNAQFAGIQAKCVGIEYITDHGRVLKELVSQLGGDAKKATQPALDYVATLVCSLIDNFEDDVAEWVSNLTPYMSAFVAGPKIATLSASLLKKLNKVVEEEEVVEDAELLCDCKFTLAYGSKILLHNTKMKLHRGKRYGLLGGNDSGKTTLMRAISNNQVDGFPDSSTVRTVFVEADIVGELSHLTCLEYVMSNEKIQAYGITEQQVRDILVKVGFAAETGGGTAVDDGVSTLSGGWRMKLALARAMLQKADILLMDEPTNHLDVMNVRWTLDYLKSLVDVTCVMVSHDSKLLNEVCSNILQIKDLKLKAFKGTLDDFVAAHPDAASFFELKKTKMSFKFPQPGFIEGIKSKVKPLMKMEGCEFTYPGNTRPTITGITVRCSLSSRVALLGPNGAGKSTLIKLLVGETIPDKGKGVTWKHPGCRFAYVAQHAFHHIEAHMDKTANEYIRWRYAGGDDKEEIEKDTTKDTPEDLAKQKEIFKYEWKDVDSGKVYSAQRTVSSLLGPRESNKATRDMEYKVCWKGMSEDQGTFVAGHLLKKQGWAKHVLKIDEKEAAKASLYVRPLTQRNVEEHLNDVGLAPEYGSHFRLSALSGGQKVKVVLAASLWNQPHIIILDEPTNYLDRESLGALSNAIEVFEGGVVMITHNNEFCSALCPETWILERGADHIARIETKGDADWMAQKESEMVSGEKIDTIVDASGNETKLEQVVKLDRKEIKRLQKELKAAIKAGNDDLVGEIEDRLAEANK